MIIHDRNLEKWKKIASQSKFFLISCFFLGKHFILIFILIESNKKKLVER